jgi:hypothetical protein
MTGSAEAQTTRLANPLANGRHRPRVLNRDGRIRTAGLLLPKQAR